MRITRPNEAITLDLENYLNQKEHHLSEELGAVRSHLGE